MKPSCFQPSGESERVRVDLSVTGVLGGLVACTAWWIANPQMASPASSIVIHAMTFRRFARLEASKVFSARFFCAMWLKSLERELL